MENIYLERYAYPVQYIDRLEYGHPDVVVVLPCHNEPDLISALNALELASDPGISSSVIVVINASSQADEIVKNQNKDTYDAGLAWYNASSRFLRYHFILENELPAKHAGVGLARKLGMDEAVRIFEQQEKDGVILCFDADSTCSDNLLLEVFQCFDSNPKITGCSIHYEHPLSGEYEESIYQGIINYELHLRYYINALRYAGFPYAYQTIGSSMAVRSSIYQKQGGMNRRKAGEDFYFLQRIIPLGNFKNLNSATIFPSPRQSDRVPFGTGRAIGIWLESKSDVMQTYHPAAFEDLKICFSLVERLYKADSGLLDEHWLDFPESFRSFVGREEFMNKVKEFNGNSSNQRVFVKRFYQWFDGFKVLKFVHYYRDHIVSNVPVMTAIDWLFDVLRVKGVLASPKQRLIALRVWDRQQG